MTATLESFLETLNWDAPIAELVDSVTEFLAEQWSKANPGATDLEADVAYQRLANRADRIVAREI